MGGWDPTHLVDLFRNLPATWIILWLGLAAVTLALLILMRTRWGQSQPLRKCAALSLLVHGLLGCFATTVKIVNDNGPPGPTTMRVQLGGDADGFGNDFTEPVAHAPNDAGANTNIKTPAWALPPAEHVEPNVASPQRQLADDSMLEQLIEPPTDASADLLTSLPNSTEVEPELLAQLPVPALSAQPPAPIDLPPAEQRPADTGSAVPDAPAPSLSPAAELPSKADFHVTDEPSGDRPQLPIAEQSQQRQPATEVPYDLLHRTTRSAPAKLANLSPAPKTQRAPASNESEQPGMVPINKRLVPRENIPAPQPTSDLTAEEQAKIIFQDRTAPNRGELASQRGGGADTEGAVEAALQWLVANQERSGRWDAARHGAGQERKVLGHDRQWAGAGADTGISALALLTLLGAGHTHKKGPYKDSIQRGLDFLVSEQRDNGDLSGHATLYARMYCHSMSALALGEAYAMTRDEKLASAVRAAATYSVDAQNPYGGWRYQPGDAGDTSQFGWQAMALRSAELGGNEISADTRRKMQRFLASVSGGQHGGLASYRPHQAESRPMTAEALYCRQLLAIPTDEQALLEAAKYITEELPGQTEPNVYYWYYGTLALYQLQGEHWERWNKALKQVLLESQRTQGDQAGSWDPDPVWGGYGGRVYSTALAAMSLEIYYRYLPLYAESEPAVAREGSVWRE